MTTWAHRSAPTLTSYHPSQVRRDNAGRVQLRVEGPVLQAYTPPATLGATLIASLDVLIMSAAWLGFVAVWTGG